MEVEDPTDDVDIVRVLSSWVPLSSPGLRLSLCLCLRLHVPFPAQRCFPPPRTFVHLRGREGHFLRTPSASHARVHEAQGRHSAAGVVFADVDVVLGLEVGVERGVVEKEVGVCGVGLG
jgi:hypothetical protein